MDRLNDEQREFVTENHNLIYSFLYSNNLNVEEWYDLAAIGLCKACLSFDGGKSQFSTFAYKCMWNQVFAEMRKEGAIRRGKYDKVLYYDAMIHTDSDGVNCSFLNLIPDMKYDTSKQAIIRVRLYEMFGRLNDKEIETANLLSKGYNMAYIGDCLGCSKQWVAKMRNKMRMLLES